MIRQSVTAICLTLTLLLLGACGGGDSTTYTAAALKIRLNGNLSSQAISGVSFTLTLPANVAPATAGGVVVTGVVTPSGTFSGTTFAPLVTYTPATTTAGTLQIALTSSAPGGVTTVGEVATVILQLAGGAMPAAASFGISGVNVADTLGAPIPAMTASIESVTLH